MANCGLSQRPLALVTGAGRHMLLHPSRARPAARAHRRARMTGDRPYRQRAIRLALGLHDPQAIDTEQRRSNIVGQCPRLAGAWCP